MLPGTLERAADGFDPLRHWPRLFASPADEPRARRTTDLLLLVTAAALLALISFAALPAPGFIEALTTFLVSSPDFFDGLWQVALDLLGLLAGLVVIAVVVRRRLAVARDLALAAALAIVLWLLVGRVTMGSWPAFADALTSAQPPPWYPSPRVALPGALIMTASPHLARPARRLGRWAVFLGALAATMLGATTPLGAIAGVLVAAIAAAAVHLTFGSSGGRPGLDDVRRALVEMGVPTVALGAADRQPAGQFLVHGTDASGDALVVKVFGRDAHDAALVSRVWRALWFREAGAPIRLGRLQQVEYEAFLTLLAGQAGVLTDGVVTAGSTAEHDAVLVLRRRGQLLDDVARGATPAVALPAVWAVLERLHAAGLAHGQIDSRHLVLYAGPGRPGGVGTGQGFEGGTADRVGLIGFGMASVAATEVQRRTDEVQTLVATVLLAGEGPALLAAREALGPDGLAAVLPYLQLPALTSAQRREVELAGIDLDALRSRAGDLAGTAPPPLQRLRRITVGSLVRVVLPGIAVVALISGLAGLDFAELVDQLRGSTWWLVALGALVAQLPRLAQAVSTMGASPVPLPLKPVYGLQLAVSYVNLAIPSSAARIAVNVRFFQRHGVPPGSALAAGALDGVGGFVVQAILLVTLLLLSPISLGVDLDPSSVGSAGRLLVLVLLLAVGALLVVLVVPPWRRLVLGWLRQLGGDAIAALRGLRSLRRIGMLFGGNLASEVLFAVSLGIFTRALGYPIGLGELLLINISVSLLSGLIPVPGGIGVAEGGLTYGLITAGMPEETAFAAVLLYRLATFYLPPIWGYFALRWLEEHEHL